jgi:hypothetical protein
VPIEAPSAGVGGYWDQPRVATAIEASTHRMPIWPWRSCEQVASEGGLRPVRWSGPRALAPCVQPVRVVVPGRSGRSQATTEYGSQVLFVHSIGEQQYSTLSRFGGG